MLKQEHGSAKAGCPSEKMKFWHSVKSYFEMKSAESRLQRARRVIASRHGRLEAQITSAFRTMGALGSERDLEFLFKISSETSHFRLEAFNAIAQIGGHKAFFFLEERLDDKEDKPFARQALLAFNDSSHELGSVLRAALEKGPSDA